jgi:hypothetical protein
MKSKWPGSRRFANTQWQAQRPPDESVIDGEMYTRVIAAWSNETGNLERTKHWFDKFVAKS